MNGNTRINLFGEKTRKKELNLFRQKKLTLRLLVTKEVIVNKNEFIFLKICLSICQSEIKKIFIEKQT